MSDVMKNNKIVIFGGTGQTGMELVRQGLALGYTVRVLARNPEKARMLPEGIDIQIGDATNPEAVSKALLDQDAVLCAVGGQGLGDSTTRTEVTKIIVEQMQKQSIQKLVVCSVVGIGKSSSHLGWFSRMVTGVFLKHAMNDHRNQEEILKTSGLDIVVFRPPQLINGEKTESYRLASETEEFSATKVRRSDVAHAMLCALDQKDWIGSFLSISS